MLTKWSVFNFVIFLAKITSARENLENSEFVFDPDIFFHPDELRKFLSNNYNFENVTTTTTCLMHLIDWSIELAEMKKWALTMADASSKIPSGILSGNVIDLGNYEECLNCSYENQFTGQYCLSRFILRYKNESLNPFRDDVLGGETSITLALCVPSTCHPDLIENIVNKATKLIKFEKFTPTFVISPEDVYSENLSSPINKIEWIITLIFLLVLILAFIATYAEFYLPNDTTYSKGMEILLAFSIRSNTNRLLDCDSGKETFKVIYGFKFLSICWIIFAQRFRFLGNQPIDNIFNLVDILHSPKAVFILSAPLAVDTFLVISGFLNSFITLHLPSRNSIFTRFLHRYLRISVPFAAIQGLTIVFLNRLEEGPLWNRIVTPAIQDCKHYWYTGLAYISNYYNPNSICLPQTWYLSVEMQLYVFSSFLLFPISRLPLLFGATLLSAILLSSVLIPFYVTYNNEIRAPIPVTRNESRFDFEMATSYYPTHMRFTAYVVGLTAGFILHRLKRKIQILIIPKKIQQICSLLVTILMLSPIVASYWLYQSEINVPYNKIFSSVYMAIHHLFWAVGIAWIIIASTSIQQGLITRAISWKFFLPLSRLTYCMYLVHFTLFLYEFGSTKSAFHFTLFDQVIHFLGDVVINVFLAYILHILFEAPILKILNIYKTEPIQTISNIVNEL